MIEEKKDIFNLKDLEVFAKKFALNLNYGSLVLLKGDLGSGKTTFIRFIINSLLGGYWKLPYTHRERFCFPGPNLGYGGVGGGQRGGNQTAPP